MDLMNESDEFKDDFVRRIINKAGTPSVSESFGDEIIMRLKEAEEQKAWVASKLTISFKFFLGGITAAILLLVATLFYESLMLVSSKTLIIGGVFVLLAVAILSSANYKRLIGKYMV